MTLGLARTNAEAHLYMELHPCEACGEAEFSPSSSVIVTDTGAMGSRYTGTCPNCGVEREFTFLIPEEILFPPADGVRFGAESPSNLLDAGEWLLVADHVVRGVPADPATTHPGDRGMFRRDLATAVAAIDEALKFFPAGAETAPDEAFWTQRGRAVRDAEPGRFRRTRLLAVRQAYQEIADRYAAA